MSETVESLWEAIRIRDEETNVTVTKLRKALTEIYNIPYGDATEDITEAREIARKALGLRKEV